MHLLANAQSRSLLVRRESARRSSRVHLELRALPLSDNSVREAVAEPEARKMPKPLSKYLEKFRKRFVSESSSFEVRSLNEVVRVGWVGVYSVRPGSESSTVTVAPSERTAHH